MITNPPSTYMPPPPPTEHIPGDVTAMMSKLGWVQNYGNPSEVYFTNPKYPCVYARWYEVICLELFHFVEAMNK